MDISRSFCTLAIKLEMYQESRITDQKFRYCKNSMQVKLTELHDWPPTIFNCRSSLNVNARLLWMGSHSAAYERHDRVT
mgnify:CR=1 FL=1